MLVLLYSWLLSTPYALFPSAEYEKNFEARYMVSGSMLPTLQVNDKVLIDKHTYQTQSPKRGDIILFRLTKRLEQEKVKDPVIHRVIGLPGEVIAVKSGKVFINKKPLSENYIADPPSYIHKPVKIPANHYFVLGDNRNNAYDSHYWGFVPKSKIIGKAISIYCPIERQIILDTTKPLNPQNEQMISEVQNIFKQNPSLCNPPNLPSLLPQ